MKTLLINAIFLFFIFTVNAQKSNSTYLIGKTFQFEYSGVKREIKFVTQTNGSYFLTSTFMGRTITTECNITYSLNGNLIKLTYQCDGEDPSTEELILDKTKNILTSTSRQTSYGKRDVWILSK